jgi:circadian clock protein KaiB
MTAEGQVRYERETKPPAIRGDVPHSRAHSGEKYILKLYISGMTLRSKLVIENVLRICVNELADLYDLEIIDIFKDPSQAKEAQIIGAPNLIKQLPLPMHRLIGDMSQTQKVMLALDLLSVS